MSYHPDSCPEGCPCGKESECSHCSGRGWVRIGCDHPDWAKCRECFGSGARGTRAPDEILTSDGRTSRGEHYFYPPAKPKPPVLRIVRGDS